MTSNGHQSASLDITRLTSTPKTTSCSPNKFGSRASTRTLSRNSTADHQHSDSDSLPMNEAGSAKSNWSTEVICITLQKNNKFRDFGFSVSNGDHRPGVFINSLRPGGLAQTHGLMPMDKVLQVMKSCPVQLDYLVCI